MMNRYILGKASLILEVSRKFFNSRKQITCFKDLYNTKLCDCIDKCKYPPPSPSIQYVKFNLDDISKYKKI